MSKISLNVISSLAVLSLVAGCGKDSGSSSSGSGNGTGVERQLEEAAPVDGSNIDGHYQAKFITLNPHVNGTIPGSANLLRKDDRLYAYVRLFAGGVKAWHMQHIYTGGRCPTMSDDTNGDGFIDINEAEAVLGKILIPLDSDLGSQTSGRRFFPVADLSGYYHYERITSFRRFLNDLQAPDKDPNDDLVKLPPGEGLNIVGKTVLIQGVTETVEFPETVGTKGRFKPFQTLPIVCGNFEKVDQVPGEPYTDTGAPGPVADVIEGQDRPADEDIPDTGETTGGTGGGSSTTGTNDSDDGNGPVSDGSGRTSTGGSTSGDTTTGSTTSGGSTSGGTTGGTTTGGSTGNDDDSSSRRPGRGRGWTGGWTGGGWTGWTGGGRTSGGTSGDGTTSGGSTTGGTSGDGTDDEGSSSSSSSSTTTTTTTTGGSSSSSSSTSTGETSGGFLGSSSGI